MKTAKQITKLTLKQLRRLVAQQQVRLAQHDLAWAGSCGPDAMNAADERLAEAKRIRVEVHRLARQPDTRSTLHDSNSDAIEDSAMEYWER